MIHDELHTGNFQQLYHLSKQAGSGVLAFINREHLIDTGILKQLPGKW